MLHTKMVPKTSCIASLQWFGPIMIDQCNIMCSNNATHPTFFFVIHCQPQDYSNTPECNRIHIIGRSRVQGEARNSINPPLPPQHGVLIPNQTPPLARSKIFFRRKFRKCLDKSPPPSILPLRTTNRPLSGKRANAFFHFFIFFGAIFSESGLLLLFLASPLFPREYGCWIFLLDRAVKKRRKKRKCKDPGRFTHYRMRSDILRKIGYRSYQEYLKSDLWSSIRANMLNMYPYCYVCGDHATQVHHANYLKKTLLGRDYTDLYTLCSRCHFKSEFKSKTGKKLGVKQARQKMRQMKRHLDKKDEKIYHLLKGDQ